MKLTKILLLVLSLTIAFSFVVAKKTVGYAEGENIVVKEIQQNFSLEGNTLPSLLDDGYSYTVSVYAKDGTTLIEENISTYKYKFGTPGEYVLKWSLENLETGEKTTAISTIILKDVVVPSLYLNGGYDEFYTTGTQIDVLGINVLDDSGESITVFNTKVLFNGTEISIANGKIDLETGSYQIVYTAKDSAGNEGVLNVYFQAVESNDQQTSAPQKKGCGVIISVASLTALIAVVASGMFLMKKKEKN